MSFGSMAELALQVAAGVVVGWVTGTWLLDRFLLRSSPELEADFGLPERCLAAFLGLFAFAVVAMVLNLITGGAIIGIPGVVPIVGAVLVASRARRAMPKGVPWLPVGASVAALLLLYLTPVIAGGSGARLGDPQWHLGWTEQLLHGQAIPTGPAPVARNAYPWGYHAILATIVRLVPGSSALVALDALHVLFVLALPVAAACLARRLRRDSGWFAAVAVTMVGGWGWLAAHGADFAASPSQGHHGADLVVASPNAVYELFPPSLPREIALIPLAAAAFLSVLAVVFAAHGGSTTTSAPSFRMAIAAGAAAGITGLVSLPLLITAAVWVSGAFLFAPRRNKLRLLAAFFGTALPVVALWVGPVVATYLRYGGFVNVTPHVGTEWPLSQGFSSWGLLLPGALCGVAVVVAMRPAAWKSFLAFGAGSAALMLVALARPAFHWHLAGNRTLLYQGRVWPPAHLLAAAFAGAAAAAGYRWLRERQRLASITLAVVLTLVGVASPALACVRLTGVLAAHRKGYIFGSFSFKPAGFVRRAAAHLGPGDVVLVHGSDTLAFSIFSFSGARLARYDDPTLRRNDLRVRYADLARRWDQAQARGGFSPDYTVAPAAEMSTARVVVRGIYAGTGYVLVKDR